MADAGSLERQITHYLWAILSPILITFGTIGNLLSIAVLSRRSMRSSSASVYLRALALADTTVLLTGLLRHFVREVTGIDVRGISKLSCKINLWLAYTSLDVSVWILVAFTFERVLSVFTPHKVKSYCTRMSSTLVVAGVVVVMVAFNGHILYGFGEGKHISNMSVSFQCAYVSHEYRIFFSNIWPWIDFSVYSLIPTVILIIGNSCIAVRMLMRKRKTRRIAAAEVTQDCAKLHVATINLSHKRVLTAPSSTSHKRVLTAPPRTNRNHSMTISLFAVNLVFLITTAPACLFQILQPTIWSRHRRTNKYKAVTNLVFAVVSLIMYINNSINFLLYCVTGSRFRKELMSVFRKQRSWTIKKTMKDDQEDESVTTHSIKARSPLPTDTSEILDTRPRLSQLHSTTTSQAREGN